MRRNFISAFTAVTAGAALSTPLRHWVSAAVVLGLVPTAALAGASRATAAVGPAVAAGVISTAAGGVGGPALATRVALREACGVAYAAGKMYVADGGTVRAVSKGTGWLTTPVGTGAASPLGDGGPAGNASLRGVCGVAVDDSGNLVISDTGHSRVRVVAHKTGTFYGRPMTGGHIYTVAGNGKAGFSGDGGPATKARLNQPQSVAVDGAGNLLIADTGNDRVRVVAHNAGTFYGRPMIGGHIYTVAGNGKAGFSGDGGPAAKARLSQPRSVAAGGAGNLLIADTGNYRVRVVVRRAGTFYGRPMAAGHIYTVAGTGTSGFSGDGAPATKAELGGPSGVSLGGTVVADGAGNLLIGDATNARIRVVAHRTGSFYGRPMTAGDIYTVAGDGNELVLRRRRPGNRGRAEHPARRDHRWRGQPADRRHLQQPGPGRGAPDR